MLSLAPSSTSLALGLGFDPSLASPADTIPGQVPEAIVVRSAAPRTVQLRGDFEAPDRVLLVFADLWPQVIGEIGAQVLDSGAALSLVLEDGSSRRGLARLVDELSRAHPGRVVEAEPGAVDTPWVRDWGPLQQRRIDRGASIWLDAGVDGAGRRRDDEAPRGLADRHGVELRPLAWALDGGAFISDGAGLCVLTLDYLEHRQIGVDGGELAGLLGALGCEATALVPTLLDEQTKHADMIAQFVGPDRLMIAQLVDELDGHSEDALRLGAARLGILQAAAALGRDLEIVEVPTPASAPGHNPRSYVNGLHLGDRYLMPSYPELGPEREQAARAAVELALAGLPVIRVDASALIAAGGALHCASLGLFGP